MVTAAMLIQEQVYNQNCFWTLYRNPGPDPPQGKTPVTGRHLNRTRLLWGDPPADGQLGREGEGQIEKRIDMLYPNTLE